MSLSSAAPVDVGTNGDHCCKGFDRSIVQPQVTTTINEQGSMSLMETLGSSAGSAAAHLAGRPRANAALPPPSPWPSWPSSAGAGGKQDPTKSPGTRAKLDKENSRQQEWTAPKAPGAGGAACHRRGRDARSPARRCSRAWGHRPARQKLTEQGGATDRRAGASATLHAGGAAGDSRQAPDGSQQGRWSCRSSSSRS